jgi:predicted MFS family arabinose efflux permease
VHRLCRGAFRLSLVRDQLTRAAYASFAFWGWFLYGFAPAVPLLRDEQGTSRAVAGLHGTAIALGTILSAAISVPLVRRYQRRGTLIGAVFVAAIGITLLVLGPSAPFTLTGALIAGIGGSILLNSVNPVLSDHHGLAGPAAISEANAIAAGCGIVAPLAVGAGVSLGLTWRAAVLVSLPLAALALVLVIRAPRLPALLAGEKPPRSSSGSRVPLGLAFWLTLGLIITVVGVEFSTTFWAADLLHTRDGISTGAGSASVSAFLVGMTAGRLLAVPLTARVSITRILVGAIVVGAAGWALLWSTHSAVVAVLGLALLGLGLAFTYPLGIVRLMHTSGGRPDAANAFSALGVGVASGSAPFVLGALADRVGTERAFLLVPLLLLAAMILVVTGGVFARAAARSTPVDAAAPRR